MLLLTTWHLLQTHAQAQARAQTEARAQVLGCTACARICLINLGFKMKYTIMAFLIQLGKYVQGLERNTFWWVLTLYKVHSTPYTSNYQYCTGDAFTAGHLHAVGLQSCCNLGITMKCIIDSLFSKTCFYFGKETNHHRNWNSTATPH